MIRLEFPWPPRQLMPNFKRSHHWTAYRKQAKAARTLGWGLTAQAGEGRLYSTFKRFHEGAEEITISYEFTPPKRGGPLPDEDNLKAALKHYLDGIADALGVNDSRFRNERSEWKPKDGAGKVVITIA
jgi:crossover junction endodeoxyribonuclease RusA